LPEKNLHQVALEIILPILFYPINAQWSWLNIVFNIIIDSCFFCSFQDSYWKYRLNCTKIYYFKSQVYVGMGRLLLVGSTILYFLLLYLQFWHQDTQVAGI
jgi:hypothetical protein